jgi:hypothetical protein
MKPPDQMLYTDIVIRAISELHRIEMSIFSLWKQLPDLEIIDNNDNRGENKSKPAFMTFDEWRYENSHPRIEDDSGYSDEENGQYYWDLHKRNHKYVDECKNLFYNRFQINVNITGNTKPSSKKKHRHIYWPVGLLYYSFLFDAVYTTMDMGYRAR